MIDPLIVILAGGEGRRIGGGKPLRTLGGKPLIDRVASIASSWSTEIRVALRDPDQIPGIDLEVIRDDAAIPGPLGGLASALKAAKAMDHDYLLTLPCDVPFLPADLWQRLKDGLDGQFAAMPMTNEQLHPACTLWQVKAWELLGNYVDSGRRSLIGFAEHVGFSRVAWAGEYFFNVNYETDLAEAERRLASKI